MSFPKSRPSVAAAALFLLLLAGFPGPSAPAYAGQASKPPQAPPAALAAHKNYLSWNPFTLVLAGQLSVGYERIFRAGERYFGLYAQYTSPMNSAMKGLITASQTYVVYHDQLQFSETWDFLFSYYGKGRSRAMRYFPRVGLSLIKKPSEDHWAGYLAVGPCVRAALSQNVHLIIALTTLKFKLWGGPHYFFLDYPLFDLAVGINF